MYIIYDIYIYIYIICMYVCLYNRVWSTQESPVRYSRADIDKADGDAGRGRFGDEFGIELHFVEVG
jgi:hypothetical protein